MSVVLAAPPNPGSGGETNEWLGRWSFANTNSWQNDLGYAPLSFTNLAVSMLGNGSALVVDSENPAWLQFNVFENDGSTNLTVAAGTVMMWVAPYWASTNQGGTGPGEFGRLIEVGEYTTNASYGWWSLYLDPEGCNLTFAAQTNGATEIYLSAPISWTTNRWHLIGLTYSATNTALYLDGILATNGPGMTVWPDEDVLEEGFFIGSDGTGVAQFRGMLDDLVTYDYPLDDGVIGGHFLFYSFSYYMNPANPANWLGSASSSPSYAPIFNAITGSGNLTWLSSNSVGCVTSTNIWLTNIVATPTTNGTEVVFTIVGGGTGGEDGPFDVFANSVLVEASSPVPWAWMGRGDRCSTFQLTLPSSAAYLILGKPVDTDGDGLTDAYELLASKTDPENPDTDGDGILDGWEILWGADPHANDSEEPSARANYTYDFSGWLDAVFGVRGEEVSLDDEGNVLAVFQ